MRHTPGPWKVYNHNDIVPIDPNGRLIAEVEFYGGNSDGVAHANARLIAAAPELLASLQELLGCCELNMDDMEPATRKAIRRATNLVTPFGEV